MRIGREAFLLVDIRADHCISPPTNLLTLSEGTVQLAHKTNVSNYILGHQLT